MTSYPDLRNEYETDPTPKQSQCRTLKPSSVVLSKKVKYIQIQHSTMVSNKNDDELTTSTSQSMMHTVR